jgi:hypothetical protein
LDRRILQPEIQDFILRNESADVGRLALSRNPFPEIEFPILVGQISARAKAKEKLPSWYAHPFIYYAPQLSIEQCSSEKTAEYKASVVSGSKLIDLTGGFGVDAYFFSKQVGEMTYCEMNPELAEISKHNFQILDRSNIECFNCDSEIMLGQLNQKFDWIYVDPARRNDSKGKVFMLQDCLPNVPKNLNLYFRYSDNILVKSAPLLDITAGLNELKFVKSIHIVAVRNEVKELLWEISKGYQGDVQIKTINFGLKSIDRFDFLHLEAKPATYALPKKILYEPNAAIMKSGGFENISAVFDIEKIHPNSHLYTSDGVVNFPGRVFSIEKVIPYTKTGIRDLSKIGKANVSVRNFSESVESLRRKHKISDGGDVYCFFTTDINEDKIVLICRKIEL